MITRKAIPNEMNILFCFPYYMSKARKYHPHNNKYDCNHFSSPKIAGEFLPPLVYDLTIFQTTKKTINPRNTFPKVKRELIPPVIPSDEPPPPDIPGKLGSPRIPPPPPESPPPPGNGIPGGSGIGNPI
jgi:hypothetical protein